MPHAHASRILPTASRHGLPHAASVRGRGEWLCAASFASFLTACISVPICFGAFLGISVRDGQRVIHRPLQDDDVPSQRKWHIDRGGHNRQRQVGTDAALHPSHVIINATKWVDRTFRCGPNQPSSWPVNHRRLAPCPCPFLSPCSFRWIPASICRKRPALTLSCRRHGRVCRA
jgi:hypothetical protein